MEIEGTTTSRVEASGARVWRDGDEARVTVGKARVHHGAFDVDVTNGAALLAHGAPRSLRADAAAVAWTLPASRPPSRAPEAPIAVPVAQKLPTAKKTKETSAPLVPLPDLRALQDHALAAAALLAGKVPEALPIAVDAFSVRIVREGSEPLSLGPGPLSFLHKPDAVEVTLSTRAGERGAPLAVHTELPLGRADVSITLKGGPVPLSLLGLEPGTLGLSELEKGSIEGEARLFLPASADRLTFDGAVQLRGVTLYNRRLATDVVHGLDLGVRAKGTLTSGGDVTLDDADFSMGAIHVKTKGKLEQKPDRVAADFSFELPRAECQAIIESLPAALVPNVVGSRWSGTHEGHLRFAVDSRRIDDLVLDYAFKNACKLEALPPNLQKERFFRPFTHAVYAPDGTVTEETTGPGTPKWVPLDKMSHYMPIAVVMTEDGGIYRKDGFNHPQIKLAVVTNLKERRFARGASSLIMQLAKNLLQRRDKTLARKLEQVILTEYIAQTFTKSEVLELYLNLVEFGPNVYGVKDAAKHYFGKSASWLSLNDSLFLAAMLPAPNKFHTLMFNVPQAYLDSFDHLIDLSRQSGLVSQAEADQAKNQTLAFASGWRQPPRAAPRP
jgi:hypothetical protein